MWRAAGAIGFATGAGLVVAATACGGKLAPVDAGDAPVESGVSALLEASVTGIDATTDGGALDAPGDGDATAAFDATSDSPACSADAMVRWDADLCVPPADDQFFASPAAIEVPAGNYGFGSFTTTGPWATAPGTAVLFDQTTLPLTASPKEIFDGGTIQFVQFAFQVQPSTPPGTVGTLSAHAQDGNIKRSAAVTVTVTPCAPTSASVLCGDTDDGGLNCGYVADHCGGLVSCGTCDPNGPLPTCFLNQCLPAPPPTCPQGQGLGIGGACVVCNATPGVCGKCAGYCIGFENACICYPYVPPTCPGEAPTNQTECLVTAQTCSWSTACGTTQCKCDPSHLWDCTTCGP
ncbi:MAG TPA: hypothetical protein VIY73_01715 [Polyangiaceae bacterium]